MAKEQYKEELDYQRKYAKDAQEKNERANTLTTRKKAAYGKTIRTADIHSPAPKMTGRESHSDAASNLLRGIGRLFNLVGEEKSNLSDLEEGMRK